MAFSVVTRWSGLSERIYNVKIGKRVVQLIVS